LKTANSGYLTRRLVDVTQDLVVIEEDCGTTTGMAMKALVEGRRVVEALRERILGRVVTADVYSPENQEIMLRKARCSTRTRWSASRDWASDEVKVRTPLTCDTRFGICASCYGRDLGRGTRVNVGEAVGVIAAQSIGEPGTQLTMRTSTSAARHRVPRWRARSKPSPTASRTLPPPCDPHQRSQRAGGDLAQRRDRDLGRQRPASASATRCRTAPRSRSPTATR
jgi:hypothetical protein